VGVLLGDHLADEDGVRLLGASPRHELRYEHLRAEVDHPDLPVVFQALLPREPLDVEDRVDADGVRVGADARPDDDELAPQGLLEGEVDLLRAERGYSRSVTVTSRRSTRWVAEP